MGLLLPDGGLTWTSVNCEPVLPPGGGSPLAVVTSFADINAIKRAEDDLRHSEERLAFVLKGADVGAWDWRIPADEVIYNHRCVGKLGYSREEFPPGIAGWKSRIHPDDLSLMESAMADHLAGRCGQYEAEYRLATRDGRWMWVLDRGQVTEWDEAGQPIRFSGIQMDITARRELAAESARAEANDLSRAMMRTIAEGVVGIGTSYPYPVRLLNPHAETLLGVSEAEALGQPVEKFISLVDEDGQPKGSIGRYTQSCDYGPFEAQVATPASPTGFPAILKFSCIHDYGGGALTMLTLQDITQRRLAERKLMLSDRVFEYSAEAILVTDASGVILSVNPAFTYITGYRPDEAVGNTPRLLKSGRHDQAFYTAFWHTLTTEGRWQGEIWDRRKDGTIYPKWTTINAVREGGRITHFVALFSDISERKEHENRIRYLAEHDHLTGLPNRRLLEERGRQLIGSGRRRDTGMAVMMIDLDRFKFVNDTLGHQIGDRLLVEVARRLVGCVRATDTVVRLGGDEFVLLLEEMEGAEDAVVVARKVHEALNLPIHIEGKALHTPPSIGISLYPNDGEDIDTLMRHADAAMYQAKEAGRNTWRFFTAEMNAAMQDRLRLEQDMRHSLENEGFELHFQPQFDVHERQIVVWEALLRWPHPERGWVGPDQVIPIAEETGLILPLGCWVLRAACREMRRWQDEGLGVFRVGINLSPHQVSQPDLVECVTDALAMYDLTPERLELEITESVLLARSPHILETLRRLKALGVSLTLDDFGTGYSSLTYLKAFAVDRVKIDRSFVRDLVHDSNDAAIVRAVISLARALNLGVVAEGVETADQQAFLLEHGCRETQGYLMGRPMAGREVAAYLDRIRDAH
ncbi:EAL domain-containing protein [bacterium]|nr:EAL domain-containing protein [bacterium]